MDIKLIGVPIHFGADDDGLVDGINTLLEAYPDIRDEITVLEVNPNARKYTAHSKLKYLAPISDTCNRLAKMVNQAVQDGKTPLVIGGDHSIAIGSIAGVAKEKKMGVMWVDAHGDMNTTETTPTGNINGIPLAISQGYGNSQLVNCFYNGPKIDDRNVVLFGISDLDDGEKAFIKTTRTTVLTYSDIRKEGLERALEEAYAVASNNTDGIHLSFDLDCIHPALCPGVSNRVDKGFSVDEAYRIFDFFLNRNNISSIDLVEYNPAHDSGNRTLNILMDLIKKIKNAYKPAYTR